MKVLLVNKFNFIKGGADRYFLELAELLTTRGVTVAKFCLSHPDNLSDKYSRYWPSGVNFDNWRWSLIFKYAGHIFWNHEASKKFERLIKDFKPDVVHVHSIFHHLSPSILPIAKRHGVPVVMHLHDYQLICPNWQMFSRGQIDESAKGGRYWRAIGRRSIKNSYFKSAVAAAAMWLHHRVLKVYEKNIDCYIAPSRFTANKVAEWGMDAKKIKFLPHFIKVDNRGVVRCGDYWLYLGRLSEEKGLDILIRAMAKTGSRLTLKIVGAGPEFRSLSSLARDLPMAAPVEFLGPKQGFEVRRLLAGAYAVIVPSKCYEVFGLAALEAAAAGKFVIAANIGGLPEIFAGEPQTALLFHPGNINDLATKLKWTEAHPMAVAEGGAAARDLVRRRFNPGDHYRALMNIYKDLYEKK